MKIICAEDCGNAPKKSLLRDISIDFWGEVGQMLIDNLSDDAVWRLAGGSQYAGKDAILEPLANRRIGEPTELHIHNIITHGNTAAINVTVSMGDGSQIEYCDVYRFSGFGKKAKIKEITSYQVGNSSSGRY